MGVKFIEKDIRKCELVRSDIIILLLTWNIFTLCFFLQEDTI
jgi:hypothetical protein